MMSALEKAVPTMTDAMRSALRHSTIQMPAISQTSRHRS